MDKNFLMFLIFVFACTGLFSGCEMHSQYRKQEIATAAIKAGLHQTMIKADGYAPEYMWGADSEEGKN